MPSSLLVNPLEGAINNIIDTGFEFQIRLELSA